LWDGEKWRHKTQEELQREITIKNFDNTTAVIKRVDPDSAKKTLGVFLSPDNNMGLQVKNLKAKVCKFADCIRMGRISCQDAEQGMRTTIWKTLKYPLAVMSFAKDTWDDIIHPIMLQGLSKTGVNRNFPRDMVFGPRTRQGLGYKHPYYLQIIK